jgi:quercetin dioxygenase-like cupin family protein
MYIPHYQEASFMAIKKDPVSTSEALKVVRLQVEAGGTIPEHHSNVDVVVTVVRGSGTFTIEGKARPIRPGDVVVMGPRERHSITADSDLELVVVHARLVESGEAASCNA